MADNSLQQDNDNIRTLQDSSTIFWPAGVVCYATTVSDGANVLQEVTPSNPLPVTADLGATDNAVLDAIAASVAGTLTVGSHAVTNAGTFAVQVDGDALTALQLIDDVVATDASTSPSKGVMLAGHDGTDARRVTVDTSGHLQVDALSTALPFGAATEAKQDTIINHVDGVESSLTDAVTALQIIDDWDETNRAKVNLIVGQAGVSAGAGAVAANTPRVTLASDDPAVALLGAMDTDTGNIATSVATVAGAVSGSEMQVDVVTSALPSGAATAAAQATGNSSLATVAASIQNIESDTAQLSNLIAGSLGHGVKTVTSAGTDEALAGSTACKYVMIQAQTDNTGLIAVGGSGVDATEATGTGIILYAGDSITLQIDNLADVYVDATVSGEGVRYTYGA